MGSNIPQAITDERDRLLKQICQERYVELTGGKVLHLFKGEDAKIMQAPVASQTSSDYMRGHSKSIANTLGIGYEFGTGDFEGFSFSGGQLSMGIHEHGANIRRQAKSYKAATYIFRAWLDEAMTRGILPKLAGADYFPNREAYCRCDFTGAKKVQADIVKIANANAKNLASGTTSRTEIAHDSGNDLEKIVMDRANEADMILGAIETVAKGRGLDMTDDAKLKIITDLVATQSVQTPDNISDILLEGAN
jgi:capsid protein